MEHNAILTIIVPAVMGLLIALFVRFGIKPKIETVYETNRRSIIRRLLIDVNNVSNQFNNAHEIFERQPNFQPGNQVAYDLTANEVAGLQHIHTFISEIFDSVARRRDTLLFHLQINEYDAILSYLANAISFYAVIRNAQPNQNNRLPVIYLPFGVDTMRRFGWRIINMFPQIIDYEFIRNMRRLDDL